MSYLAGGSECGGGELSSAPQNNKNFVKKNKKCLRCGVYLSSFCLSSFCKKCDRFADIDFVRKAKARSIARVNARNSSLKFVSQGFLNTELKHVVDIGDSRLGIDVGSISVEHSFSKETLSVIDALTGAFGSFVPQAAGLVDAVETSSIKIMEVVQDIGVVGVLVYTTINFVREPSAMHGTLAIAAWFVAGLRVLPSVREQVSGLFVQIKGMVMSCVDGFSSQANGALLQSTITCCTTFISLLLVGKAPPQRKLAAFVKMVSDIPKFFSGAEFCFKKASEFIEHVVNFIRVDVLSLDPIKINSVEDPNVQRWIEEVNLLAHAAYNGKLFVNHDNADKVFRLVTQGNGFLAEYRSVRDNMAINGAVRTYMNVLKEVKIPFDQANLRGHGTRIQPLMVLVRGASGTGKSALTIPLLIEVLGRVLPEDSIPSFARNHMDFIYNRQHEHQYWDGYLNQFACVFDDFGQCKDIAGDADNEFMDMIRAGNLFPNTLHMAHLEHKGTVNFSSKLVVATTNMRSITPNSIIEPEAVERRFDLVFDIYPKVEFCTDSTRSLEPWLRRLDRSALKPGFDDSIYEIKTFDFRTKVHSDPFSYRDMIGKVVAAYTSNYSVGMAYQDHLDEIRQDVVNGRVVGDRGTQNEYFECQGALDDTDDLLDRLSAMARTGKRDPATWDCDDPGVALVYFYLSLSLAQKNEITALFDEWVPSGRYSDVFRVHCIAQEAPAAAKKVAMARNYEAFLGLVRVFCEQFDVTTIYERGFKWKAMKVIPVGTLDRLKSVVANAFVKFSQAKYFIKTNFPGFYFFSKFIAFFSVFTSVSTLVTSLIKKKVHPHLYDERKFEPTARASSIVQTVLRYKGVDVTPEYCDRLCAIVSESPWTVEDLSHLRDMVKVVVEPCDGQKSIGADISQALASESGSGGKTRGRRHAQRNFNKQSFHLGAHEFGTEGGSDAGSNQIANKVCTKSMYTVTWSGGIKFGHALAIKGSKFIMPRHFLAHMRHKEAYDAGWVDKWVVFTNVWRSNSFQVPVSHFAGDANVVFAKDSDWCIVDLPCNIAHPDLLRHFVPSGTLSNMRTISISLVTPDHPILRVWNDFDAQYVDSPHVVSCYLGDGSVESIRIGESLQYEIPTSTGDCGSVVLLQDSLSGPAKIVGMHIAGTASKIGCAAIVSFDLIDKLLGSSGFVSECHSAPFGLDFSLLREEPKPLVGAAFTNIRRSKLYGMWGAAKTEPARLKTFEGDDGVIYEPMALALSKYCPPRVDLDLGLIGSCCDSIWSMILNNSRKLPRAPRVFTFEESVLGIPGVPYCDAIPRNTSAGYPYCLSPVPGFPGKTRFFGRGDEYDLTSPDCVALRRRVESIIVDASKGLRCEHIFCDFLKDERRPIDKVRAGKTRLISASPIELLIATRMYFLDFSMYLMDNRISNGFAIGVNPYSAEWDAIARRLLAMGTCLIAGDYSNHDGSLQEGQMRVALDLAHRFYDDFGTVDYGIREVLFSEVCSSVHMNAHKVYRWNGSLPSGHALTTIVGSVCNHVNVRLAWHYILRDLGYADPISLFNSAVFMVVFGDDNLLSVGDDFCLHFNPEKLQNGLKLVGMKYTNETKSGPIGGFRTIDDVSFLKRSFRYETILGRFVAPLDLAVVLEMPYWTKRGSSSDKIALDNVQNAIVELSLHGEAVFMERVPSILQACRLKYRHCPEIVQFGRALLHACDRIEFY
jgi:hypothetical protein